MMLFYLDGITSERTVLGYDYRKTIPRLAGTTYVSNVS